MKDIPLPYGVVVQAGPDEILGISSPEDLNLVDIDSWPSISGFIVALPEIEGAEHAADRIRSWGYMAMIGHPYNVAQRLLDASLMAFNNQAYIVRVLAIWKNIDLLYIDQMVAMMQSQKCDLVSAPRDFDATLAADIASIQVIKKISEIDSDSAQSARAKFNAFGYIESQPEKFNIRYAEPAPKYDANKCKAILNSKRSCPENEYFGRDYSGSRYNFLIDYIPEGARVLDIACGSGYGSNLMTNRAAFVLGCDYLDAYIETARSRFPENEKLKFIRGDGQNFLYQGGGYFDTVVSLHTLEHVPDDYQMIHSLAKNLCPGGLLIIEVPLLAQRPLGAPVNPYHFREYTLKEAVALVNHANLSITKKIGMSRGFPVTIENARDAVQIHAIKR